MASYFGRLVVLYEGHHTILYYRSEDSLVGNREGGIQPVRIHIEVVRELIREQNIKLEPYQAEALGITAE